MHIYKGVAEREKKKTFEFEEKIKHNDIFLTFALFRLFEGKL